MKRIAAVLGIFLLLTGMLFASAQKEGDAAEETLVYATTDKITDLDPANAYDFHTWEVFENIGRGLLVYEPGTTKLVPGLAESYSANDAGDVYTFKLRSGLTFSDGSALTSQDVKWSIDRVMRLEGDPSWLVTDFVESVETPDDRTVVFNLKNPVGFFPALVATVPYYPVNPDAFPADQIVQDPGELAGGQLTGPGPYKIVSFKRDEEIVLEANESYYGDAPNISRVVIRYYADATTMRLALEQGDVDLVYKQLNPSDTQDLLSMDKYNSWEIPGAQIRYLCFETSESVFQDARLRRAVSALIDRQPLIEKVFLGLQTPLYSMVPAGMKYHTDAFESELGDGNVQLAERLLQEAGYSESNPFEFELWYTPSHYGDTEVNMAEVLQQQFEATPMIEVNLKSAEWSTYTDNFSTKTMPAFLLGWYPDYMDPDNYTAAFAGTSGSAGLGIYFSDPQWDRMFQREQSTTDSETREEIFTELQQMWTEEVPTAPIFQGTLYVFSQPNVKGVNISARMIFNYDEVYFEE